MGRLFGNFKMFFFSLLSIRYLPLFNSHCISSLTNFLNLYRFRSSYMADWQTEAWCCCEPGACLFPGYEFEMGWQKS